MTEDSAPIDIKLIGGNPTDEELAALLAVLSTAYAVETQEAVAAEKPNRAWTASARGLRLPLQRDIGWVRSRRVRW